MKKLITITAITFWFNLAVGQTIFVIRNDTSINLTPTPRPIGVPMCVGCPAERFFFLGFVGQYKDASSFQINMTITTDGMPTQRELNDLGISKAENKERIAWLQLISIYEFKNEKDYYNFLKTEK